MQESPWPGDPRSLCWHLGMVLLMSWVELVERPSKNPYVLHDFGKISSNSGFSNTFLRWLEIPRGSIYSFTNLWSFGWWLVFVGYESSVNSIAFWASFSSMICWPSSFGCWIFWIHPHRELTWKRKITFFKWLGFSLSSKFSRVFYVIRWDCLAQVVLVPIHPVLKERKSTHCFRNCPGESSGWYLVSP